MQESAVEAESLDPTAADVHDGWLPLGNEDSTPFVNEQTGQFEQMSLMELFSTEMEQINHIDEAESMKTVPSAFSFTQAEIDDVLLVSSNTTHAREHIVDAFQKRKTTAEIAELLRHEFHGCYGIKGINEDYVAWYAEDGIRLHQGRSTRYEGNARDTVLSSRQKRSAHPCW